MTDRIAKAWTHAAACLPEDWLITDLYQLPSDHAWLAGAARQRIRVEADEREEGFGRTPGEALTALATKLSAREDAGGGAPRDEGPAAVDREIDIAWADAESALLEGWTIRQLYRSPVTKIWMASATVEGSTEQPGNHSEACGSTPTDALRALAVTLRMKPA